MVAALDPDLLARHPVTMIPEYPGTDRGHLLRAGRGPAPDEIDPARDEAMERLFATDASEEINPDAAEPEPAKSGG